MFEAIEAALFAFLLAIVLYYYSMVLLDALWNSKGARKARKEAIEAFISLKKFLHEIESEETEL